MFNLINSEPPKKSKTQILLEALTQIDSAIARGWRWIDIYESLKSEGLEVSSVDSLKGLVRRARKRAQKLGISRATTPSNTSLPLPPGAKRRPDIYGTSNARTI